MALPSPPADFAPFGHPHCRTVRLLIRLCSGGLGIASHCQFLMLLWATKTAICSNSKTSSFRLTWAQFALALGSLRALELSCTLIDLFSFARRMKRNRPEKVLIVGAGLGGIQMSLELIRAGFRPTIFDQGREFGGTWAVNGYPGCKSDVDATNFLLSSWIGFYRLCCFRGFSTRDTMRWYCNHLAVTAGLLPLTQFGTRVNKIVYQEDNTYHVSYEVNKAIKSDRFDYVVVAIGALSQPSSGRLPMPQVTSMTCRHSAEMDDDFNKSCKGKRVAVIGGACSGTQMLGSLVRECGARSVDIITETPMYFFPGSAVDWPPKLVLEWILICLPFGLQFLRWSSATVTSPLRCQGTNEGTGAIASLMKLYTRYCYESIASSDAAPTRPVNTSRMVVDYDFFDALLYSQKARLLQARVTNWKDGEHGGVLLSLKQGGIESVAEYDKAVLATGFQTDWTLKLQQLGLTSGSADSYFGLTLKDHNTGRLFFMYGPNTNSTCEPITNLHEIQACAIVKMICSGFVPSIKDYQASRQYIENAAHPNFLKFAGWYMAGGNFSVNWPTTYAEYAEKLTGTPASKYAVIGLVVDIIFTLWFSTQLP